MFTRKWAAYMFDTAATADTAIQSVLQAVSEAGGKVPGLRLRDRQRFTVHQPQISGGNESTRD